MNALERLALEVFISVGGVGLILRELRGNAASIINLGFDQIEKSPAAKAFLMAHREDIEAFFDAMDQAAKARLDKDAAQAPPPEAHQ